MRKFFLLLTLFVSVGTLVAKDSVPRSPRANNSSVTKSENKRENLIAKSDATFGSEDEEDEEFSAANSSPSNSNRIQNKYPSPKKTKPTGKPGIPANNTSWSVPIAEEMDPEKRSQITKDGLRIIETNSIKGNKGSVKAITKQLLSNPIPEVRAEAAKALGNMGKGLKSLHKVVEYDGYEVRQQAYRALEKIGSRSSLKYFVSGTRASDADIKISSYKGLGKTKSNQGRDLILKTGLNSKDPNVVSAALDGLGYFSRKEDLDIFKKYLKSESTEQQAGAIRGLGNSKLPETLDILAATYYENPNLEPDIIFAVAKKKTLGATLFLLKIMQSTKNESYHNIAQKELVARKAFGKYALIKNPTASLKKYPKANSEKVTVLTEGEVAKIKKVTEKRFKVKMNNNVVENRYYLLQATGANKENNKKGIVEGWVFGEKISVFNVNNPAKKPGKPGDDDDDATDEDSEDEVEISGKKDSSSDKDIVPTKDNKKDNKKDGKKDEYDEEDEDD